MIFSNSPFTAQALALKPGPSQASLDPLSDHATLEGRKGDGDGEHEFSG